MVLLDLLQSLGLGEQLFVAAILMAAAWYALKTLRLGKAIGSIVGSGVVYGVVVCVAMGLAVGLGWLDPRPELVLDTVNAVTSTLGDLARKFLLDHLEEVLGQA